MGLAWAAVAILIWSGSLVMLRAGIISGLTPHDLAALRFGTAALCLMPVLIRRGFGLKSLGCWDKGGLWAVLGMVLCFGAPYIAVLSLSLETATANAAGLINPGAMAVFTVAFPFLKNRRFLSKFQGIGLIVITVVIGLAILFPGPPVMGHLLLIGTGLLWAIYAAIVQRVGIDALHATALVAVWSAILYLPLYAILLPKAIGDVGLMQSAGQALFQGVLVSGVAVYAFTRSAELLGPIRGATLPALIPAVTLGLAYVILGEPIGGSDGGPAVLVGIGVALILRSRSK